jgi:hypothetical protein
MDDTVLNKSELVIDALQYAHDHDLDINSREDVEKILEVLDPDHHENIDVFMELLSTSDTFLGMKAKNNFHSKANLSN